MSDVIFNPFDRANCGKREQDFIANATKQVRQAAQGKDLTFFADSHHESVMLTAYLFSRSNLKALQDVGIRHLMLEAGDLAKHVMYDAVADGRLTPLQYVMANTLITPPLVESRSDWIAQEGLLAEGIQTAASMGIKVHGVEHEAGSIKPEDRKRYFFHYRRREEFWLRYILANPSFFSQPDQLAEEIAKRHQGYFQTKKGRDLQKLFLSSDPQTLQRGIYLLWYGRNVGKTFQTPDILINRRTLIDVTSPDVEIKRRAVEKRIKDDEELMAYIDLLRAGEPAAVVYGNLHVRSEYGGFVSGLSPTHYCVIHLFDHRDVSAVVRGKGWEAIADEDDLAILLGELEVRKIGNLRSGPLRGKDKISWKPLLEFPLQ